MSTRKKILSLLLIIISLSLLIPGVTQPILTLSGTIEKSELASTTIETMFPNPEDDKNRQMLMMFSGMMGLDKLEGQLQAYQQTRSIWGTVEELYSKGNVVVALLVMLFSVVIPVSKLLMQFALIVVPVTSIKKGLQKIVGAVSKWSMADVFLMAIIVSYLAGSAKGDMGGLLTMHANLEVGFYWFLAYCLFSIASSALIKFNFSGSSSPNSVSQPTAQSNDMEST